MTGAAPPVANLLDLTGRVALVTAGIRRDRGRDRPTPKAFASGCRRCWEMRNRIQIDVGFGDAITPRPQRKAFPTLLADYVPPQLLIYPLETVVAEKFEAAIDLAEANSRMKDFRDLYVLAVTTPFHGAIITQAVARTFERRGTSLSAGSTVMTDGFARDADRQAAWAGYLRKERIDTVPSSFEAVMPVILMFVGPPFRAASEGGAFSKRWNPATRTWR